ncbi:MAG: hypothetical protein INQ03_13795 [Candidatus Heimdallarchaeota archaeon]|nr:hypothetical protein [Candidatus Heimdallarchaeota archaeon]
MTYVNIVKAVFLGIFIWFTAFIWSMILMILVGVDMMEPNFSFGYTHPKYWLFEIIMTPTYLVFALFLFRWYFLSRAKEHQPREAIEFGIIIMLLQFILDILVLVFAFGNGFEYFIGLVTLTYLSIPLWAILAAKRWTKYRNCRNVAQEPVEI